MNNAAMMCHAFKLIGKGLLMLACCLLVTASTLLDAILENRRAVILIAAAAVGLFLFVPLLVSFCWAIMLSV